MARGASDPDPTTGPRWAGPDRDAPTGPRPPRRPVDPRGKTYWLIIEVARLVAVVTGGLVLLLVTEVGPWTTGLLVVATLVMLGRVVVVPRLRFGTHRWEATATAVYAKSGWLGREWRVAPLSRVQTVEATRNVLQRVLGLSSVLVTTASSKGPIVIDCLDVSVADDLVAALTHATEQTRGDAT